MRTGLLLLLLGFCIASHTTARVQSAEKTAKSVKAHSPQFRAAVASISPASVSIETQRGPREIYALTQSKEGDDDEENGSGSGTGIVFDSRGYVLTCYHVVANADAISVTLSTGKRCKVQQVISDPMTDLAVLRIDSPNKLPVATFGDSDLVEVGDWVLSVTSPYGLRGSVSAGVVSAVQRELPESGSNRFIQSDAASNPGSSGGPLVNVNGEVIGMCEGGYGASEGFHGISFAIPSNLVRRVSQELITNGRVRRCYLGCASQSLTPQLAECFGVANVSGVVVTDVSADTPAAIAGFQTGDVVTQFGGVPIHNSNDIQKAVEQAQPGRAHSVKLLRSGKEMTISVTPRDAPNTRDDERSTSQPPVDVPGLHDPLLGIYVDEISQQMAERLGYSDLKGVLITHVGPGTKGFDNELAAGMVIRRLGNTPVKDVQQFRDAIALMSQKRRFVLLISTPDSNQFVGVDLGAATSPPHRSDGKDE